MARKEVRFIGIDLAFREKNGSGLCVLNAAGEVLAYDHLHTDEEILSFVSRHAAVHNIIVIDAPLIVMNETGQRCCETLIGEEYGARHASCHSTNLNSGSCAGKRGPNLVKAFQEADLPVVISRDAAAVPESSWPIIETYPHPAHLELFKLPSVIRYKKGNVETRKNGLACYVSCLKRLERHEPSLGWKGNALLNGKVSIPGLKGGAIKRYEDCLDGLFCAYVALFLWRHRGKPEKWRVYAATEASDFITIPVEPTLRG